jgi:recombination protein RecT
VAETKNEVAESNTAPAEKQVARRPQQDLKAVLTSDKMQEQFAKALPKHLSAERFVRVCVTALTRTPELTNCTQESFFKCILDLSAMGLEPDGVRAHLIPYKNNKENTVECTLLIDYKGLVELVRRSGDVVRIHADVVCTDDLFEFSMGQVLKHTWDITRPRGPVIAAYAMVVFKAGESQAVVLSKDEVDAVRGRSKSKASGPWVTDYAEMAKKTCFRRLCKWLTLSPDLLQHIANEDEAEFGHYYRTQNASAGLLNHRVIPIDPFKKGQLSDDSNGER